MTLPRTPTFRLDGRRALVAGASSGIGEGCAVAPGLGAMHDRRPQRRRLQRRAQRALAQAAAEKGDRRKAVPQAHLVGQVRDAQSRQPDIQRVADRISAYFVPAVILNALFWAATGD